MRPTGLFFVLLSIGCSGSGHRSGFDTGPEPTDPPPAVDPEAGAPGPSLGASSGAPTPPPKPPGTQLYAHTDTTLFRLDPTDLTAKPTSLGTFDCVGKGKTATSMTDLAVTKDGKLFGVSEGSAFPLDTSTPGTVHCGATWSLPQTKFYGLTVAPENTVDAAEVLIAADGAGGLWKVDATSGAPTQVGTLGTDPISGNAWALSGDVVFLANAGSPIGFATVRTCDSSGSNCSTNDTLIEVDVKMVKPGTQSVLKAVRGAVTKGTWCTNAASPASFGGMFGIVAYEDRVYGFSRKGDIVEIHNDDGSACLISSNPSLKYAGAGVTTAAPVIPPPLPH